MTNIRTKGHLAALLTILIWGTTYISTKILLIEFSPIEILLSRFFMGYLALYAVYPHFLPFQGIKKELIFAGAGLCGICLYYFLENTALTMTYASNVGIISSVAPFFTAIVAMFIYHNSQLINKAFLLGFIIAMTGIYILTFQNTTLTINPWGDFLAVIATVVWAFYSNLVRKIGTFGLNTIMTTRRVFFYGLIFMLPALCFYDVNLDLQRFYNPIYLGNILFLGLGASALCFVTWNYSVEILGAITTSIYIYLVPVITIISAVIILQEELTAMTMLGTALTLAGLFISHHK